MNWFSTLGQKHPKTVEEAFTLLCRALWLWQGSRLFYNQRDALQLCPQDTVPEVDAIDRTLSQYVRRYPGMLEAALRTSDCQAHLLNTLPDPQDNTSREKRIVVGKEPSLLAVFLCWASPRQGDLLWRTLQALEELAVLRLSIVYRRQYPKEQIGLSANRLTFGMAEWVGSAKILAAKQTFDSLVSTNELDVLTTLGKPRPPCPPYLPDILPSDEILRTWTASQINNRLAHYRAMSITDFHQMLYLEKFLAEGEQIGEVILGDLATLAHLGVTRHQLFRAFQEVILAKQDFLTVSVSVTMGRHQDPFHSDDTFFLNEVGGSAEYVITNTEIDESLHVGDMLPYLIRRACFFEGNVPYRLDPAKICRVLESLLATVS